MSTFGLLGAVAGIAALRDPGGTALIDDRGSLTFAELDARSNALANLWRSRGLTPGRGVAVLARNHRGLVDAILAGAKCGARIILLNTDFGQGQVEDVVVREGADLLVHDEEYSDTVKGLDLALGCVVAWTDLPSATNLDSLIAAGDATLPPAPATRSKIIILTSGTTGTPKGAEREDPRTLAVIGGLLSRIPFRANEVTHVAVPMFHAMGFFHTLFAMMLGSTLVVHRRFDARQTLHTLEANSVTAFIAVPVMIRRLLDLGTQELSARDLSALRVVYVSGSQLSGPLCNQALAAFGPIVYNLYGSTEVAYASIATPEDLLAAPSCVGRVVPGSVVRVLDEDGNDVPTGSIGRIFVGNRVQFEGYTDGNTKPSIDGLLSSGDVGHFDTAGRLFIDGRDDEMIVSGGENVFPREVEETLAAHPDILEVAVIGVPDEEFGQRLRSFIVARPGATLTEETVRHYVKIRLARFKVPRDIRFVDALPRTPTGKILKRDLDSSSTPA
ncbi:AMP-binding protein [Mycolicibacterium sp.]|uniref:AMP-binding protein n=1 Tax=Mycolicibacterium sp. TaxID=2320850 RepID=UPI003D0AF64E